MTSSDLLARAARLAAEGTPFVLATVVRRTPPSSARPGQRALVGPDGEIHGWLGGSCIEPTVRLEAAAALRDGRPRVVVFSPDADAGATPLAEDPIVVVHPMTCHSGGRVEVYLEPQLPEPVLALFGDSPVSRALAGMGRAAGFRVLALGVGEAAAAYPDAEVLDRLDRGGDPGRSVYAVVATMGDWDEEAARRALEADARYVGLVASPRRAEALRRRLRAAGVSAGTLERLVSPAGLDLGAEAPGEIAVSILAEVVAERRASRAVADEGEEPGAAGGASGREAGAASDDAVAVDPVCGMMVEPENTRDFLERGDETIHFCSRGCLEAYEADAARYAREGEGGTS